MSNILDLIKADDQKETEVKLVVLPRNDLIAQLLEVIREIEGIAYAKGYRAGTIDTLKEVNGGSNGNTD